MDPHKEFVKLSFDIIYMKNKLISLLLEIYEKEIYKEKGCRTIHEYGFKYAKLSKEVVDKAIRTLRHLENKPFLKQAIETQGIHKVAMVATIATAETDKLFAGHVRNLSKPALFEFSKELRQKGEIENQNESFCQAVPSKMIIEMDAEMQILFLKFKEKHAKNYSNREALRVMLKKFDEREMSVEGGTVKVSDKNLVPGNEKITFTSRHIQKKKDLELREKYHHKCAYPGCTKTVEVMHHRVAFAFERSHESVIPLCDVHHEFAHNGLISYELSEPEKWQLKTEGNISVFDQFYLENRRV